MSAYIDQIQINNSTKEIHDTGARTDIGTKANLTTTEKGSLVGAINEIHASADALGIAKAPAIRATASGSVAHFADAVAAPMALDIVINPKISGYTNVTVTRAGRNLLKDTGAEFPNTNKGVTATKNSDGSITITGSGTGSSDSIIAIGLTADLKLITGKRYILSGCPSGGSSDTYRLRIAAPTWAIDTGSGVTFTPTGTYGSTEVQITVKKGYTLPTGGVTFKPMIRPASDTDATFKPYNGTDYEITLPDDAGTVYGGNLHINQDGSAALTVTYGYIASYAGETLPGAWISDSDEYASGTTPTTGAQVVYALASSTTYPFTAQQISSLFGENNVWADTGDVTAEYTADTKLYIQQLTGRPDEDMTADADILSGSYFMVGNRLFIATANIENGHAIIPGTNCTETNLADALNTINA